MIRGVIHVMDRRAVLLEGLEAVRPPETGYVWIDIQGQSREDLELLGSRFHFHPLALEDCEHLDQRPKLDEYDDHLFLVIHGFMPGEVQDDVYLHEVHVFFAPHFLITVHISPHPAIDRCWERLLQDAEQVTRGTDHLLYRICDGLVDSNFPTLECLSQALESLEDEILGRKDMHPVPRFVALKRSLSSFRRVISPQREVIGQLLRREDFYVSEQIRVYFRDIYDHLVRLTELVEVERELLASARDAHFTMLSQRTNEIMKRLTMASIVFLPLTVITGFFGMNFAHLPFENDNLLILMLCSMVIIPISMLLWFQRRRWI